METVVLKGAAIVTVPGVTDRREDVTDVALATMAQSVTDGAPRVLQSTKGMHTATDTQEPALKHVRGDISEPFVIKDVHQCVNIPCVANKMAIAIWVVRLAGKDSTATRRVPTHVSAVSVTTMEYVNMAASLGSMDSSVTGSVPPGSVLGVTG